MEENRFSIRKSSEDPFSWTVTDNEFGVRVTFTEGTFEMTKDVTFLPGYPQSPKEEDKNYIGYKCLCDIRAWLRETNIDLYLFPSLRKADK